MFICFGDASSLGIPTNSFTLGVIQIGKAELSFPPSQPSFLGFGPHGWPPPDGWPRECGN
jgi:hypothetical protein